MDRQIIAIGGGGFGRHPGVGIIEKYILQQSDKEKPNICFIPTATGDSESYKVSYYATLNKLNCNPTHLDFLVLIELMLAPLLSFQKLFSSAPSISTPQLSDNS